MSRRISTLLVSLAGACSGQLSMGGLLNGGGGSPPPAGSTASAPSSSSPSSPSSPVPDATPHHKQVADAGAESYSLADPPGFKGEDATLLTMPKFFQASTMYWAVSRGAWKAFWLADVLGDQMGENARMTLVHWCARQDKDLTYIACIGDAHRLDKKRLLAELEDPSAQKYRASALENFDEVQKLVAKRDAEIAKREKDDPALVQIFDVIPKLVWKQWDALASSDAALLASARSLEIASQKPLPMAKHGPSRKVFAGCIENLAPAFAKAVHTGNSKGDDFGGTFGIARTPQTYIATLAAYYCARGQDLAIAGALGKELTQDEMLRGPRMGTIEAVLAKSHSLKFDDKTYSLTSQVWRDSNYINEDEELWGDTGGGHAVIAKVEKQGEMLHITFKKEQIQYDECTKREAAKDEWHYDRNSGNISPVTYCVASVTKKEMVDVAPIDVPATQSAGLEAGRFLDYQTTKKNHAVRAVWDSPKQKKLLAIYGVSHG